MQHYDLKQRDKRFLTFIPRVSNWRSSFDKVVRSNGVNEISLGYGLGWDSLEISFLERFPQIESLIINIGLKADLSVIQQLPNLKRLSLRTMPTHDLDISQLPKLREILFPWSKKFKNWEIAVGLQYINVDKYPYNDLSPISTLKNLRRLYLESRKLESLDGLTQLNQMLQLDLYNCQKLVNIQQISQVHTLQYIDIESCKKITALPNLQQLEALYFLSLNNCGDIENLQFLEGCKALKVLQFRDSNIKDGNLDILHKIQPLGKLSFSNRRHYNYKLSDFQDEVTPFLEPRPYSAYQKFLNAATH